LQNLAYVRLASALIICLSVIIYQVKDMFVPIKKETVKPEITLSDTTENKTVSQQEKTDTAQNKEEIENQEKTENSASSQAKEEVKNNESIEVSAKDIKGNIIEKYISPYNAPQSYGKVFMKNSTGVSIDIKKLLEAKLGFKIAEKSNEPQVLIMHTHATESFMSSDSTYYTSSFSPRSRDNSKNMVKIGEEVARVLNNNGIKTLHDKTQHDYPEYTGSYSRSKSTVNWYLKKYPSIKVVLDLHRDSVASGSDKIKLATKINGKKAAQVMLVMGSQTGSVTGHPKWKENLKLAFRLQQKLEQSYPTLARPLMLASKLYNQHLTTGSLLIEFGTDANSLSEAVYSAELVGKAISQVLKE